MQSAPLAPRRADKLVSIALLVVSAALVAAASVFGLLLFALIDNCSPERCSMVGAVISMFGGLGLSALAAVLGIVFVVRMFDHERSAWPVAAATLVAVVVILGCAGLAYSAAVGWFEPVATARGQLADGTA